MKYLLSLLVLISCVVQAEEMVQTDALKQIAECTSLPPMVGPGHKLPDYVTFKLMSSPRSGDVLTVFMTKVSNGAAMPMGTYYVKMFSVPRPGAPTVYRGEGIYFEINWTTNPAALRRGRLKLQGNDYALQCAR